MIPLCEHGSDAVCLNCRIHTAMAEAMKSLKDYVPFHIRNVKCECGSDKAKLPIHSDWCPKARKP